MLRLLIVTDSFPFPPKNGKDLPTSEIFKRLGKCCDVDLLLISPKKAYSDNIRSFLPKEITNLFVLEAEEVPKKWYSFFVGRTLTGSKNYDSGEIEKIIGGRHYNLIWVSPITCFGFIDECRRLEINFYESLALGSNDIVTYLYRDSINEMLFSKIFGLRHLISWGRSFFLFNEEKRVLKMVDFIHVQTEVEKRKAMRMVEDTTESDKIIVAPNGIKKELFSCTYSGPNSDDILYMTHLDGGRKSESKWFITKVWPIIKKACPKAKLNLVGKPPKGTISYIEADRSIIIRGYVDDLEILFSSVRLSVVPTFHGTGLINRILDSLTAGVPIVSTRPAIYTFPGIEVGKHIEMGNTPRLFAEKVIELYNSPEKSVKLSNQGRSYAKQWPSWDKTVEDIYRILTKKIDKKNIAANKVFIDSASTNQY